MKKILVFTGQDLISDNELETRTGAIELFRHRPTTYMKGYNGYLDLREVQPV